MPVLSVVLFLYFGACAYLYFYQRTMLYAPSPPVAVASAETISLQSDGETLRILHVGSTDGDAIIYFGGNAEAVGEMAPHFLKHFPHQSVYLVNYRGYGGSTGEPSEDGFFKDALTVYDFAHSTHANISVIGRSLGSGVAVYLAANREVKKLVLTSPYDSIENVAKRQYPMFPVSLLLKDKFASDSRVGSISIPTLVVLADTDNVIPHQNTAALVAAFRKTVPERRRILECDHNSILLTAAFWHTVSEFLS